MTTANYAAVHELLTERPDLAGIGLTDAVELARQSADNERAALARRLRALLEDR